MVGECVEKVFNVCVVSIARVGGAETEVEVGPLTTWAEIEGERVEGSEEVVNGRIDASAKGVRSVRRYGETDKLGRKMSEEERRRHGQTEGQK